MILELWRQSEISMWTIQDIKFELVMQRKDEKAINDEKFFRH